MVLQKQEIPYQIKIIECELQIDKELDEKKFKFSAGDEGLDSDDDEPEDFTNCDAPIRLPIVNLGEVNFVFISINAEKFQRRTDTTHFTIYIIS